MQDQISDEVIHYGIKTDHSAVSIQINLDSKTKGPGYWKFNASLLRDKEYTDNVPVIIQSILNERNNFKDINSLWEWIKYNIRKHAMEFSKRKSYLSRKQERTLESALKTAQEAFANNPSHETKSTVDKLQQQLESFLS